MPEKIRKFLEPKLVRVACVGFQRKNTDEFGEDVAKHIRDGRLYVVIHKGQVEGFAVIKDFQEFKAVYLAGLVKTPKAPKGIIERIVKKYIDDNKPEIVVTRTQNDRVVEIMTEICQEVVPLDRPPTREELAIINGMGLFSPELDTSTLIVEGCYGGCPLIASGARRRSKYRRVTDITDMLNYDKGDALLLVGYI